MAMLEFSQELLPLIQTLIPGFLMTMVFYWFAEVPEKNQFDRILQALVGTSVIQAIIHGAEQLSYLLGSIFSFGGWSTSMANMAAMLMGVVFGVALAYFCNKDLIYSTARRTGLTTKASTEDSIHIYQSLATSGVVLHLIDGRRLMGHIDTFPNNKQTGFFLISSPSWVHGEILPCQGTRSILISSSDVQWVEFLEPENDNER